MSRRLIGTTLCTGSVLFLLVATTKHSLTEAARFSGWPPARCATLWHSHAQVAITTLAHLAKAQARPFAKALQRVHGLPWKSRMCIDATLQHRARLHPDHTHTCHHGKGYVIGHPWTNVVLVLGDILMPRTPMPFSSQRYGQPHALEAQSAPARVGTSLGALDLDASLGAYERREVRGLAESGYDDKKSEKAMAAKGWHCMIALRKTRSVTAPALALRPPTSQPWCPIDTFCRRHRRRKGATVRLATRGNKRTRMDLRIRPTAGSLRSVGQGALGGSARRSRPDGRRQYLVCTDRRATARQMVPGSRMRWAVALCQTWVKQPLGFADGATHGLHAVMAHVHWGSWAYLLRHRSPPGLSPGTRRLGDKQRALQQGLAAQEKRPILQQLTYIGGVQRYKDERRQALAGA